MKDKLPELMTGSYQILYDLGIRKRPGLTSARREMILRGEEIIMVKRIKHLKYSIWGQMEYGWVCLYMNQTYYAVPVVNDEVK